MRAEYRGVLVRSERTEPIGRLIVPRLLLAEDLVGLLDVVRVDVGVFVARFRVEDLDGFVDALNRFHHVLHVMLTILGFGVTSTDGIAEGLEEEAAMR